MIDNIVVTKGGPMFEYAVVDNITERELWMWYNTRMGVVLEDPTRVNNLTFNFDNEEI